MFRYTVQLSARGRLEPIGPSTRAAWRRLKASCIRRVVISWWWWLALSSLFPFVASIETAVVAAAADVAPTVPASAPDPAITGNIDVDVDVDTRGSHSVMVAGLRGICPATYTTAPLSATRDTHDSALACAYGPMHRGAHSDRLRTCRHFRWVDLSSWMVRWEWR